MTATTTGLSTGNFTRLNIADSSGELTDILTLIGEGTNSGGVTSVTVGWGPYLLRLPTESGKSV